jgi:hypothetical protein
VLHPGALHQVAERLLLVHLRHGGGGGARGRRRRGETTRYPRRSSARASAPGGEASDPARERAMRANGAGRARGRRGERDDHRARGARSAPRKARSARREVCDTTADECVENHMHEIQTGRGRSRRRRAPLPLEGMFDAHSAAAPQKASSLGHQRLGHQRPWATQFAREPTSAAGSVVLRLPRRRHRRVIDPSTNPLALPARSASSPRRPPEPSRAKPNNARIAR